MNDTFNNLRQRRAEGRYVDDRHTDDLVGHLLRNFDPRESADLVERVTGRRPERGANAGTLRMNAGNILRGWIREQGFGASR